MTNLAIRTQRRRWPAALLFSGSIAAVLIALLGDSPGTTAAAVLFVLSTVLLAALGRRADRGSATSPLAWRVAAAAAAVAAALLLYLADQAVIGVALLSVAILFTLLVVLLGVLVAIVSAISPPAWMLDADGHLLGFVDRIRLAREHWAHRAKARPGRAPERVYRQLLRDTAAAVWRGPDGQPVAFSHLHVEVHPDTVRALDGWMPIEDIAADLARGYADAHSRTRRKSAAAVVLVSTNPEVPVGTGAVAGSFREARPPAPQARAWARLAGPAEGRGQQSGQRLAPSPGSSPREGTQLATPDMLRPHDDSTVLLLQQPDDRTRIIPSGNASQHRLRPADTGEPPTELLHSAGPSAGTGPGPGSDATEVVPASAPEDATELLPAGPAGGGATPTRIAAPTTRRPVLLVRRCQPDGRPLPGAREYLLDGDRARTVGRDHAADIPLEEGHVSRVHLRLVPGNAGWSVVDESSLGTHLNGRSMVRGIPAPLSKGDVLELGTRDGQTEHRVLLQVA